MMGVKQQGVALITAILMVALATVAAVAMATRQQLDIRRTGNLLHGTQAITYGEAAESWARVVLERDLTRNAIDHLNEDWHTRADSMVEGGGVTGCVYDMQGRFNINSIIDNTGNRIPAAVDRFKSLLQNLGLADELADYLADFIDEDVTLGFPVGAEDNDYLVLQQGYRTSNRPLASVTELRLVKGFDAEVISKLIPHIIALPEAAPINVNTATAEVLRSLVATGGSSPGISLADVENLIKTRKTTPFTTVADFLAEPGISAVAGSIVTSLLSVNSQWFQLRAVSATGQANVQLTSLIQRVGGKTSVIMRERLLHEPLPKGSDEC